MKRSAAQLESDANKKKRPFRPRPTHNSMCWRRYYPIRCTMALVNHTARKVQYLPGQKHKATVPTIALVPFFNRNVYTLYMRRKQPPSPRLASIY